MFGLSLTLQLLSRLANPERNSRCGLEFSESLTLRLGRMSLVPPFLRGMIPHVVVLAHVNCEIRVCVHTASSSLRRKQGRVVTGSQTRRSTAVRRISDSLSHMNSELLLPLCLSASR